MLTFRYVEKKDLALLFKWTNQETTRRNSYYKESISLEDHTNWFNNKLQSKNIFIYIFSDKENTPVGQVRIEKGATHNEAVISISVDEGQRGKGYSTEMISKASDNFFEANSNFQILAYVFKKNEISLQSFKKAGYLIKKEEIISEIPSYILCKKNPYAP